MDEIETMEKVASAAQGQDGPQEPDPYQIEDGPPQIGATLLDTHHMLTILRRDLRNVATVAYNCPEPGETPPPAASQQEAPCLLSVAKLNRELVAACGRQVAAIMLNL